MMNLRESLTYDLSASAIDEMAEKIDAYLVALKTESKNRHRIRLSMEEILLRMREAFGEETACVLRMGTHFGRPRLLLEVQGVPFDPTVQGGEDGEFSGWSNRMLGSMGLYPLYSYADGKNQVLLKLKKPRRSPLVSLLLALAAAVLVGLAGMIPAKEVGGDFYDFFMPDDDHLIMVVADVSGKGVPAALFMVIAKTLLKNSGEQGLSPKEILEKVNGQLCENNEEEMFVTVWLGKLQLSTGELVCANAGHEDPVLLRADGTLEILKQRHGFVLAGMSCSRYTEQTFFLNAFDKLFVCTDGVTEATSAAEELYGKERMLSALRQAAGESTMGILSAVKADIDRFVGEAPQFDDITMLVFEMKRISGASETVLETAPQTENLEQVTAFVEKQLCAKNAPPKILAQINIAVDEIFSNITRYSGAKTFSLACKVSEHSVILRFCDDGVPYDPTKQPEPDVTLAAEERQIGGLGIYMVRKTMDDVRYTYTDGQNVLTVEKSWA